MLLTTSAPNWRSGFGPLLAVERKDRPSVHGALKKLVSLVGYCKEAQQLMLVLRARRDLRERLYGMHAGAKKARQPPVDWRQRLHIVQDAARGMMAPQPPKADKAKKQTKQRSKTAEGKQRKIVTLKGKPGMAWRWPRREGRHHAMMAGPRWQGTFTRAHHCGKQPPPETLTRHSQQLVRAHRAALEGNRE